MVQHTHSILHFQKRIKKYKISDFKKFMDKAIFFIGIIAPIMTIPQLYNIWVLHSAAGIAISTWITYLFTAIFWLIYALLHKELPLIIVNILWVIFDALIIIGTFIYR